MADSSAETKRIMTRLGFVEYQGRPVGNWANPDSNLYWAANGLIFVSALALRKVCQHQQGPRFLLTIPIIMMGAFSIWDRQKWDTTFRLPYYAQTPETMLEFTPMSRNAWYAALEENKRFQTKLKEAIAELEQKQGNNSQEAEAEHSDDSAQ